VMVLHINSKSLSIEKYLFNATQCLIEQGGFSLFVTSLNVLEKRYSMGDEVLIQQRTFSQPFSGVFLSQQISERYFQTCLSDKRTL